MVPKTASAFKKAVVVKVSVSLVWKSFSYFVQSWFPQRIIRWKINPHGNLFGWSELLIYNNVPLNTRSSLFFDKVQVGIQGRDEPAVEF